MKNGGALVLCVILVGCHTYVPVPSTPDQGAAVRARLTAEGAVRLAQLTGDARTTLNGVVVEAGVDGLELRVPIRGIVPELQRNPKVADTLAISSADIVMLEEQVFSRAKTIGLTAGLVGVLAAVIYFAESGGTTSIGNPMPEPTRLAPDPGGLSLFRIPVGWP